MTRGKAGYPPRRLDTSWWLESYDALTIDREEPDSDDYADPMAGLVSRATKYPSSVEIPVSM